MRFVFTLLLAAGLLPVPKSFAQSRVGAPAIDAPARRAALPYWGCR